MTLAKSLALGRNYVDQFGEINIKQFGAKGDGSTDDSEAIQNALDFAEGKTLKIPDGEYKITKTLYIKSKTLILGNGESSKIILGDGYNLDDYVLRPGSRWARPMITNERNENGDFFAEGITVKNIAIYGNENEPLVSNNRRMIGLYFDQAKDIDVFDTNIYNINYFPEHESETDINGMCFLSARSKNIKYIGGKLIKAGYQAGGFWDDTVKAALVNVYVDGGNRISFQVHRGAEDISILGCTMVGDSRSIHFHGISSKRVKKVIVSNCHLNSEDGVVIWGTDTFKLTNSLINSFSRGIDFGTNCKNLTFHSLDIDTSGHGFDMGSCDGYVKISNTSIYVTPTEVFGERSGILATGSPTIGDLIISDSVITATEARAMYFDLTNIKNVIVANNKIKTSDVRSIECIGSPSEGYSISINNNKIENENTAIEIRMDNVGRGISIVNNFIQFVGERENVYGINTIRKTDELVVNGNIITGFDWAMRFVASGTDSENHVITGNNFKNNGSGFTGLNQNVISDLNLLPD